MRYKWIVTALAIAAFGVSFVSIEAQRPNRRRNAAKKAKAPKGLNAERAPHGEEPTWWIKKKKPSLDVQETTLDNGMKVLILKHGELPMVATYLWYKVGAMDEPAGMTGVAHYLEHMMFKGSKRYNKGDVDKITVASGGTNNAFTSSDYTAYYFNFPKANWTQALDIEHDRMTSLALSDKEFDAEKKVVQEEIYRAKDDASDRMWVTLQRNAFGESHPYAHPVLGWEKDIAALEAQEMREFYEHFYTPDNATMVIVGAVDPAEALKEVKKRFDSVPRGRFAQKRVSKSSHPRAKPSASTETIRFAEISAASGQLVLPAESTASIRNPVRDVLGDILTSGENSRLYKRLVIEEKLVPSIGAFNYERRLAGSFHLSFSMYPKASDAQRARVIAIIKEEIKKLASEGPTKAEIRKAVVAAEVSSQFSLESVDGLSSSLGRYQTQYGDWRYIDHYIETLKQITPKDVQHVCSLWDFDKDAVVGWLLPNERELDQARPIEKAPDMPVFAVKEIEFDNGLKLLLLPSDSGPKVVSLSANFEAGRRTQPADKNGLTSLLSAMIGAGTSNRSRAEIAKAFEDIGGTYGASSSGISAKVLAKDIDKALEVVSDMLMNANFPADQLELERKGLLAGIAAGQDNHGGLARRANQRLVYGKDHPMGGAIASNAEAVKAYSAEDLLAHYKRYVAPNNTRIVVSGRFDADAFAAKAKELLGGWEKSKGAEFRRTGTITEPSRNGVQTIKFDAFDEDKIKADTRVLLINHPEKTQCICRMSRVGFKRDSEDYVAAKVLDNILGTSPAFSDRMSAILRDEMGLAYTTYSNLADSSGKIEGSFLGYIGTRAESVPQAMLAMRKLIDQIATEQVTDEELSRAKSYLLSSLVFDFEGNDKLVSTIDDLYDNKLGWDYYQSYAKALEAITKDDVLAVAKKYLDTSKMVLVVAGPTDRIPNSEAFFKAFAKNEKPESAKADAPSKEEETRKKTDDSKKD